MVTRILPGALALLLVLAPASASAEDVYFSTKALLKNFFKASKRVTYVKIDATANADELRRTLGYVPKKKTYAVFIAKTGETIDGYAIVDEQMGQHLPITFGVKLAADGTVERTEVMVYREGYGDEIREGRFKRQFVGKSTGDAIALGDDVVAISGATISSKSMAIGVKRAVALVALARRQMGTVASARP